MRVRDIRNSEGIILKEVSMLCNECYHSAKSYKEEPCHSCELTNFKRLS